MKKKSCEMRRWKQIRNKDKLEQLVSNVLHEQNLRAAYAADRKLQAWHKKCDALG